MYEFPFLPIQFFKNKEIKTGNWTAEEIFRSSGTTDMKKSQHYIFSLDKYHKNALQLFEDHYDSISKYSILALLPGYLERSDSSLVSMVNHFMSMSRANVNGFFLNEFQQLHSILLDNIRNMQPTILIGVTFALIDFARKYSLPENECIIVETGGMKGRGKELLRKVVHSTLRDRLASPHIHSEYGMTELLSQAYSFGEGLFEMNDKMRVMIRPIDDPFGLPLMGKLGRIDVIDLANEHTCAFIATDDLGIQINEYQFKVRGRIDNSDIRGCNLLYQ